MIPAVRATIASLLTLVAALLLWPAEPSVAATRDSGLAHVYVYDSTMVPSVFDYADEGRGPPSPVHSETPEGAVDYGSHGAMAGPRSRTISTCDTLAKHALLDRSDRTPSTAAAPMTQSDAQVIGGEHSSSDLARVAAKSADEAFSAGKYLNDSWYKSTFPNRTQSVQYHLAQHGKGRTAVEHTRDAMDFFAQNQTLGKAVILRDGTAGIKIATKQSLPGGGVQKVGGYWTSDGRLVTYWD